LASSSPGSGRIIEKRREEKRREQNRVRGAEAVETTDLAGSNGAK
jgi:hypothetical protein